MCPQPRRANQALQQRGVRVGERPQMRVEKYSVEQTRASPAARERSIRCARCSRVGSP